MNFWTCRLICHFISIILISFHDSHCSKQTKQLRPWRNALFTTLLSRLWCNTISFLENERTITCRHCAIQFILPQYSYAESHSTFATAETFFTVTVQSSTYHAADLARSYSKYGSSVPEIRNSFTDADIDSAYMTSNYFMIMNKGYGIRCSWHIIIYQVILNYCRGFRL
jgi:hypothetical protein